MAVQSATQSTHASAIHSHHPISPRRSRVRCVSSVGADRGLPSFHPQGSPRRGSTPSRTCPQFPGVPVVITLRRVLLPPGAHSRTKQKFFTFAIRRAIRQAAALVVPRFRATRGRSSTRAVTPRSSTRRLPRRGPILHPVDDAERCACQRVPRPGWPGVHRFLGTLEPRKNVPNLVRGWTGRSPDLPILPHWFWPATRLG